MPNLSGRKSASWVADLLWIRPMITKEALIGSQSTSWPRRANAVLPKNRVPYPIRLGDRRLASGPVARLAASPVRATLYLSQPFL